MWNRSQTAAPWCGELVDPAVGAPGFATIEGFESGVVYFAAGSPTGLDTDSNTAPARVDNDSQYGIALAAGQLAAVDVAGCQPLPKSPLRPQRLRRRLRERQQGRKEHHHAMNVNDDLVRPLTGTGQRLLLALAILVLADAAPLRAACSIHDPTHWCIDQTAFSAGAAVENNRFGAALAFGDFNGDGFDDLAVGVPRVPSAVGNGGAVNVFFSNARQRRPSWDNTRSSRCRTGGSAPQPRRRARRRRSSTAWTGRPPASSNEGKFRGSWYHAG